MEIPPIENLINSSFEIVSSSILILLTNRLKFSCSICSVFPVTSCIIFFVSSSSINPLPSASYLFQIKSRKSVTPPNISSLRFSKFCSSALKKSINIFSKRPCLANSTRSSAFISRPPSIASTNSSFSKESLATGSVFFNSSFDILISSFTNALQSSSVILVAPVISTSIFLVSSISM